MYLCVCVCLCVYLPICFLYMLMCLFMYILMCFASHSLTLSCIHILIVCLLLSIYHNCRSVFSLLFVCICVFDEMCVCLCVCLFVCSIFIWFAVLVIANAFPHYQSVIWSCFLFPVPVFSAPSVALTTWIVVGLCWAACSQAAWWGTEFICQSNSCGSMMDSVHLEYLHRRQTAAHVLNKCKHFNKSRIWIRQLIGYDGYLC